jgi:Undecaprenyl-phosphate galactose phosphotransferase WbaP
MHSNTARARVDDRRPAALPLGPRAEHSGSATRGARQTSLKPGPKLELALAEHLHAAPAALAFTVAASAWSLQPWLRRVFDTLGAALALIAISPVMLAVMLLLAREGGSPFFGHERIGRGGRRFKCLKFRTMVPNADEVLKQVLKRDPALRAEWLRDHKLRNDPRVTALGRFLRRTSLDELPQLINVLKGEMSLVGPRPVVLAELPRYGHRVAAYLAVRPGLTGLWQVSGRSETTYRRRVAMDAYYVRHSSFVVDLYLLLRTAGIVLSGRGAY